MRAVFAFLAGLALARAVGPLGPDPSRGGRVGHAGFGEAVRALGALGGR